MAPARFSERVHGNFVQNNESDAFLPSESIKNRTLTLPLYADTPTVLESVEKVDCFKCLLDSWYRLRFLWIHFDI